MYVNALWFALRFIDKPTTSIHVNLHKGLFTPFAWLAPGAVCAPGKEERGSVRPYTTE
jgi:hypothetical protein